MRWTRLGRLERLAREGRGLEALRAAMEAGRLLNQRGKMARACWYYQRVADGDDPELALQAVWTLARVLDQSGDKVGACDYYRRVMNGGDRELAVDAAYFLGRALYHQVTGDGTAEDDALWDETVSVMRFVNDSGNPAYARDAVWLALMLGATRQVDDARQVLDRMLEHTPAEQKAEAALQGADVLVGGPGDLVGGRRLYEQAMLLGDAEQAAVARREIELIDACGGDLDVYVRLMNENEQSAQEPVENDDPAATRAAERRLFRQGDRSQAVPIDFRALHELAQETDGPDAY